MDKQSKREDDLLKKLVTDSGLERPSEGFQAAVMDKILNSTEAKIRYTPLISAKGWWLLAISFTAVLIFLYMNSSGDGTFFTFDLSTDALSFSLPEFNFSSTLIYGILFLSLFIFQVPLLKKYFEPRSV